MWLEACVFNCVSDIKGLCAWAEISQASGEGGRQLRARVGDRRRLIEGTQGLGGLEMEIRQRTLVYQAYRV